MFHQSACNLRKASHKAPIGLKNQCMHGPSCCAVHLTNRQCASGCPFLCKAEAQHHLTCCAVGNLSKQAAALPTLPNHSRILLAAGQHPAALLLLQVTVCTCSLHTSHWAQNLDTGIRYHDCVRATLDLQKPNLTCSAVVDISKQLQLCPHCHATPGSPLLHLNVKLSRCSRVSCHCK
jgi:hypothetical protein